jgi:hypothetical protein
MRRFPNSALLNRSNFRGLILVSLTFLGVQCVIFDTSAQPAPLPPIGGPGGGSSGTCSLETREALERLADNVELLRNERERLVRDSLRGGGHLSREELLRITTRIAQIDTQLLEARRLLQELANVLRRSIDDLLRCGSPRALSAARWLLAIVLLPDPTDVLIWVVVGTPLGDGEPLTCDKVERQSESLTLEVARACTEDIFVRYGYPPNCILQDEECLACKNPLDRLLLFREFWENFRCDDVLPLKPKGETTE